MTLKANSGTRSWPRTSTADARLGRRARGFGPRFGVSERTVRPIPGSTWSAVDCRRFIAEARAEAPGPSGAPTCRRKASSRSKTAKGGTGSRGGTRSFLIPRSARRLGQWGGRKGQSGSEPSRKLSTASRAIRPSNPEPGRWGFMADSIREGFARRIFMVEGHRPPGSLTSR